jgi:hypothetical protein
MNLATPPHRARPRVGATGLRAKASELDRTAETSLLKAF